VCSPLHYSVCACALSRRFASGQVKGPCILQLYLLPLDAPFDEHNHATPQLQNLVTTQTRNPTAPKPRNNTALCNYKHDCCMTVRHNCYIEQLTSEQGRVVCRAPPCGICGRRNSIGTGLCKYIGHLAYLHGKKLAGA
jgi:hypothetical protein